MRQRRALGRLEPVVAAADDGGDAVFRALADASRRRLLDCLFEHDGQSLADLAAQLPSMTRFGVMKHLRQLEAAGLVITRRAGRAKLHYLNPVPIRLLHDRWIGKYAEPWVGALADLKQVLEGAPAARPGHSFEVALAARPEQVWQALTRPELTERYLFRTRVASSWQPGARVAYLDCDGRPVVEGQVLEVQPPWRLATTWRFLNPRRPAEGLPSRVLWEILPTPTGCRLVLTHTAASQAHVPSVINGWPMVLSTLKDLFEPAAAS